MNRPRIKTVEVKLQVVERHMIDLVPDAKQTLGGIVDELVTNATERAGDHFTRTPNRITIDLNPHIDNPASID